MSEESMFDLGPGFEGTQPMPEEPPALLPRSKVKYVKGEDGKSHAEYKQVYLMKLGRPAEEATSRFDENETVLSIRLGTAGKVKIGDSEPRFFTIFDDIPSFPTEEQIKAQVEADDEIEEGDKETRIGKRLKGLRFDKRRAISLMDAIAPRTLDDLQQEDAEGLEIGVAVGVQRWDGGAKNTVEKYLPASEANITGEGGDDDEV